MRKALVIAGLLFAAMILAPEAFAKPPIQHPDPVTDSCWGTSVSADKPCYTSTGGYPGCTQPTDYTTCTKYCECGYKKNLEKCDGGKACTDIATSEKNACLGNCIADYQ